MKLRYLAPVALTFALTVPVPGFAASAQGWQSKLDHVLQQAVNKGHAPVRVIIWGDNIVWGDDTPAATSGVVGAVR